MRLWTIQTEAAVTALEASGELINLGHCLSLEDHSFAYSWMKRKMEERLGPAPSGDAYPIWAWKSWGGQRSPRPDLRRTAHLPKDTKGACIEIDVSDRRILLSDFDRWHAVLAGQYLPDDERDEEHGDSADRQAVEQSWERIFELDRGDPLYHGPIVERRTQATLWSIRREEALSVQWFKAR